MTLERDGFLSESISAHADEAWKSFCPRHVDLVERVNRFAISTSATPRDLRRRDADLFTALFLARAIQDFQGAVLLGRWGLRAQSRAMVRATFESALHCRAASQDLMLKRGSRRKAKTDDPPSTRFVDAFKAADHRFKRQVANENQAMAGLSPDQEAMIDALLQEQDLGSRGGDRDIKVHDLAKALGLSSLYTNLYRPLSQDAHPAPVSIDHHVMLDPERKIIGLRSGPDYVQLADTLALAIYSLIVALQGFLERLGTPEESTELNSLEAACRALFEKSAGAPRM